MALWGDPIERTYWQPAGGRATLGEIFTAARNEAVYVSNTNGRVTAYEDAYDARIDAVRNLTGITLENPMRVRVPEYGDTRPVNEPLFGAYLVISADARARFDENIAAIAAEHPEYAEQIGAGRPIEDDVNALVRQAEEQSAILLHSNSGPMGWLSSLAGGMAGGLRDPLFVYTMLAGAGPSAARTVAGRIISQFGREAAVNAVVQAALEPFVQANRAAAGLPSGIGPALYDIGMAGLVGGAFGGGGQALAEGARALIRTIRPRAPETAPDTVRGAVAAVETDTAFNAARPANVDLQTHDVALSRAIDAAERPANLGDATSAINAALRGTPEPDAGVAARAGTDAASAAQPDRIAASIEPLTAETLRAERLAEERRASAEARAAQESAPAAEPATTQTAAAERPQTFAEAAAALPEAVRQSFRAAEPGKGDAEAGLIARLTGEGAQPSPTPGSAEGRAPTAARNAGHPYLFLSDRGRTLRDGSPNVVLATPGATALKPRLEQAFPGTNFLTVPEAIDFMRSGAKTVAEWRAGTPPPADLAGLGRRPAPVSFEPERDAEGQVEALVAEFSDPAEVMMPEGHSLQTELQDIDRLEAIANVVDMCRLL